MKSRQRDLLLEIAAYEVGYLEKHTNALLDSKLANAGFANFTKYWRDMRPSWQGQPWCACFVSWVSRKAEIPETVIPTFFDCDVGMSWFKARKRFHDYTRTPKPGDLIFFGVPGDAQHVGFVSGVNTAERWVYTIEGNTNEGRVVIVNGGAVCAKNYPLNNIKILGYGRPDYEEDEEIMTGKEIHEALNEYYATLEMPEWAEAEFAEAVRAGVTDGTNPMQLIPRYQAALMAYRANKNLGDSILSAPTLTLHNRPVKED